MRLKFPSLSLLDHQNMPKPIPHCSNFIKIVFWAWQGFFALDQKTSFTKKFSIDPLNLNPGGCLQNPKFAFYHLRLSIDFWSCFPPKSEIIDERHSFLYKFSLCIKLGLILNFKVGPFFILGINELYIYDSRTILSNKLIKYKVLC